MAKTVDIATTDMTEQFASLLKRNRGDKNNWNKEQKNSPERVT